MICSRRRCAFAAIPLAAYLLSPAIVFGIVFPQVDDFQNGTTQLWTNDNSTPAVANVANGGPSGAGDKFLQVSSGTYGDVPDLDALNGDQWSGNFVSAGVSGIARKVFTMGILDSLENSPAFQGALGQLEAAVLPVVLGEVMGKGGQGGLSAIVAKLEQGGLGAQVKSWIGNGQNIPITAEQL